MNTKNVKDLHLPLYTTLHPTARMNFSHSKLEKCWGLLPIKQRENSYCFLWFIRPSHVMVGFLSRSPSRYPFHLAPTHTGFIPQTCQTISLLRMAYPSFLCLKTFLHSLSLTQATAETSPPESHQGHPLSNCLLPPQPYLMLLLLLCVVFNTSLLDPILSAQKSTWHIKGNKEILMEGRKVKEGRNEGQTDWPSKVKERERGSFPFTQHTSFIVSLKWKLPALSFMHHS